MHATHSAATVLDWWFGGASDEAVNHARQRSAETHPSASNTRPPNPLTEADAAIVAGIRAGDESQFDTLFRTHFSGLADFAAATTGDIAVAEELAADVFFSLWRRRESWNPAGSVSAYLYRAVRNLARNHVRDTNAQHARVRAAAVESEIESEIADLPSTLEDIPDRDARTAAVWSAVDALPETRRTVVHLRWRAHMGFEEIAVLLGTSPAAVKMQLSRALAQLRRLLPTALE